MLGEASCRRHGTVPIGRGELLTDVWVSEEGAGILVLRSAALADS